MSRTLRRVNARYNYDWVLRTPVGSSDYCWTYVSIPAKSREGRKALARYHSDAGFGDYWHATPPRWYRHQRNRRADRREALELHRWWRDPDREVVLLPRVRDASWYW